MNINIYKRQRSIKSLADMFILIVDMKNYLDGKIDFDVEGKPAFKKEFFLQDWPKAVVPYDNRNGSKVIDKASTVLCFFEGDRRIYPRMKQIFKEIEIYRQYMGVTFPDITITEDMDAEWQDVIIVLNQLFAAILAVNGIKIICNTRIGGDNTIKCMDNIPRGIMGISGFYGCNKSRNFLDALRYINKMIFWGLERVIIYGKEDKLINDLLQVNGIAYRYYPVYRKLCSGGKCNGRL